MAAELTLVIPSWEKFQHYKKTWVPWIKNYNALLAKESYLSLTGHQRGVLHGIWLAYSMSHGDLAYDTRSLSRRLNIRVTKHDLEALNHAGFITSSSRESLEPRGRAEMETFDEKKENEKKDSAPKKPARERNVIWDFVVELEGEPLDRQRAGYGRIVSDLLNRLGDTPADAQLTELRRRHGALASAWGDAKATARALVNHWERAGRIADGTYHLNGANGKGADSNGVDQYAQYVRA